MLIPEPGNRLITPAISGVCFEGQASFSRISLGICQVIRHVFARLAAVRTSLRPCLSRASSGFGDAMIMASLVWEKRWKGLKG